MGPEISGPVFYLLKVLPYEDMDCHLIEYFYFHFAFLDMLSELSENRYIFQQRAPKKFGKGALKKRPDTIRGHGRGSRRVSLAYKRKHLGKLLAEKKTIPREYK